jgi:hypothetical protein
MQFVELLPPGVAKKIKTKRNVFIDDWFELLFLSGALVIALGLGYPLSQYGAATSWTKTAGTWCLWGGHIGNDWLILPHVQFSLYTECSIKTHRPVPNKSAPRQNCESR